MWKRLNSDSLVSITAIVVSVCALFVTIYQTILMREQQSAAVWPKLIIAHGFVENAGDSSFYRLFIRNVGIGPAIIRRVEISYKNQQFTNMVEYARAVWTTELVNDAVAYDWTELSPDDVIPQGERIYLFDTHRTKFANAIIASRKNLQVKVTYTSIYGEERQTVFPKE